MMKKLLSGTTSMKLLWDVDAKDSTQLSAPRGSVVKVHGAALNTAKLCVAAAAAPDERRTCRKLNQSLVAVKLAACKTRGQVPVSYLMDADEFDEPSSLVDSAWFVGQMHPFELKIELAEQAQACPPGTFLVCEHGVLPVRQVPTYHVAFVRSVTEDGQREVVVRHISRDRYGNFELNHAKHDNIYESLQAMQEPVGGPPRSIVRLTNAAPRGLPTLRVPPPTVAATRSRAHTKRDRQRGGAETKRRQRSPLHHSAHRTVEGVNLLNYTISCSELEAVRSLGYGHFGTVEEGLWRPEGHEPQPVAMKKMKSKTYGAATLEQASLIKEASTLVGLKHANLVRLIGLCWEATPIIVLELMDGALNTFLAERQTKRRRLTEDAIFHVLRQVASGMDYLAEHNIIHRDLAARNCLVRERAATVLRVAVSDFGLAKALEDETFLQLHTIRELPYRWTSIETLKHRRYSLKSDVWSFGILIYEVQSHGGLPYYRLCNEEVIDHVKNGGTIEKAAGISRELRQLQMRCFVTEHARPTFKELVGKLDEKFVGQPRAESPSSAASNSSTTLDASQLSTSSYGGRQRHAALPPRQQSAKAKPAAKQRQRSTHPAAPPPTNKSTHVAATLPAKRTTSATRKQASGRRGAKGNTAKTSDRATAANKQTTKKKSSHRLAPATKKSLKKR